MSFNNGSLRKLSLGCGRDVRPDHVNVDIVPLPGVDVVHDLNRLPLPFSDAQFEEVRCDSILEHLPYVPLLRDIHRILAPSGRLSIQVPHFSSPSAYEDPQHVRFFTSQTLRHFAADHIANYALGFAFSRLELCHIRFVRRWAYPWNYMLEPLVNLTSATQRFYENSPLRMFPADQIRAILIK
jgi:SAM-dependent methyltransferase